MELYVEVDNESLNKYNEELCGDTVSIQRNKDSVIIVLADGLGSGVKANILSTLTSTIISTMLRDGSTLEDAVDTITHTLPVCKVRKLAYSTFTILQIFNDASAYLVEFDSPPLFFIRDGKSHSIERNTRILNGKTIKEAHFNVQADDCFVMVSDGVIHAGVGGILNLGWQWRNVENYLEKICKKEKNAISISKLLITACNGLYMDKPGDDTTAVTVKLREPCHVVMLTGPPQNPEMDKLVVDEFINHKGKKIACGGTTANMIARETGRKMVLNLDYPDKNIPPTAHIQGIDLVTEGIITLTKTVEKIKRCALKKESYKGLLSLNQDDGASQLSSILLEDCTHLKILVGKAVNPAHQNPNLPINFSVKLKLIEELVKYLKSMGKIVEVEYY